MSQRITDVINDLIAIIITATSLASLLEVVHVIVGIVIPILTFAVLIIINHRKITAGLKTFVEDYLKCKKDEKDSTSNRKRKS
jgi:Mn2+/Fe2+ NRAMP family transporter